MPPTQTYRTLSASQLDHPLFNPDTVGHLKVPLFEPVSQIRIVSQYAITSFFLQSRVRRLESVGQALETVVRQVTKDIIDLLAKAYNKSSLATRLVLGAFPQQQFFDFLRFSVPAGHPGCGKSFLLLQAVEHCARSNWVVIYIPRGTLDPAIYH